MKPPNSTPYTDKTGRVPLNDDQRERRIGSDIEDTMGCVPLLTGIVGLGLFAYATLNFAGFLQLFGF